MKELFMLRSAADELFKAVHYDESEEDAKFPEISEVIFDEPYTTVKFSDGTQATVKTNVEGGDVFSEEQGILQCVFKRAYGKRHEKDNSRFCFSGEPMKAAIRKARRPRKDAAKAEEARLRQKEENLRKCEEIRRKAQENRAKRGPSIREMLVDVKRELAEIRRERPRN